MAMSVLKLPQTLLHEQADACLALWESQLPAAPLQKIELDASALLEFDSSALAVLLGLRRLVLARSGSLEVTGMSERLRELAGLYGVRNLLEQA
jgi:phospholipid transport system transporter-binding protein